MEGFKMAKKFVVTSARFFRKIREIEEKEAALEKRLLEIQNCRRAEIKFNDEKTCDEHSRREALEGEKVAIKVQKEEIEQALLGPLRSHLSKVNGKANAHVLRANDIVEVAEQGERILEERGVSKKNRVGTEIEFRRAGKKANATYARKASPQNTTFIRLVRVADGWRLVEAVRQIVWCNQKEHREYFVSSHAKDDIVRKALDAFSLHRSV